MTESSDDATTAFDLVEIPIGTFRHYISFIEQHDLWDEATRLLAAKGIKSVILDAMQMDLVRQFVATKGADMSNDPRHAGSLVVPECSLVCRPPRVPQSPGGHDGGTSQPM